MYDYELSKAAAAIHDLPENSPYTRAFKELLAVVEDLHESVANLVQFGEATNITIGMLADDLAERRSAEA